MTAHPWQGRTIVRVIDGKEYPADAPEFCEFRFRKSDGRQIGGGQKFALVPEFADAKERAAKFRKADGFGADVEILRVAYERVMQARKQKRKPKKEPVEEPVSRELFGQ